MWPVKTTGEQEMEVERDEGNNGLGTRTEPTQNEPGAAETPRGRDLWVSLLSVSAGARWARLDFNFTATK